MLNAYQDMFSAHYYEIPDGYKLKMRINDMHGANQKRYLPTPKLASIQKAAKSAGFDIKVTFANLGLAGVTKFYKYKDYGESKEPWIRERDCLNSGGVLPQIHDISELTLLLDTVQFLVGFEIKPVRTGLKSNGIHRLLIYFRAYIIIYSFQAFFLPHCKKLQNHSSVFFLYFLSHYLFKLTLLENS